MNKLLVLLGLIALLQFSVGDDVDDIGDREGLIDTVAREEAVQFLKRLFHSGTRNEEQKRETYEVYEEKCKSIVPTQRHCPKLRTWSVFKDYENGE